MRPITSPTASALLNSKGATGLPPIVDRVVRLFRWRLIGGNRAIEPEPTLYPFRAFGDGDGDGGGDRGDGGDGGDEGSDDAQGPVDAAGRKTRLPRPPRESFIASNGPGGQFAEGLMRQALESNTGFIN